MRGLFGIAITAWVLCGGAIMAVVIVGLSRQLNAGWPLSVDNILIGIICIYLIFGVTLFVISMVMSRWLKQLIRAAESTASGKGPEGEPRGPREIFRAWRALEMCSKKMLEISRSLEREKERLRSILDALQDGVVLLDKSGSAVALNKAMQDYLGGITDVPISQVFRSAEVTAAIDRVLSGQKVRLETRVLSPRERVFLVSGGPVGNAEGGLLVFHDLTELHRLQRVRQDFVANVSHEFRNPVATIKAAVETLLEMGYGNVGETEKFAIETIARQAERLSRLTGRLLDLARLESGAHGFKISRVRVSEVVLGIVSDFEEAAKAKGLALEFENPLEEIESFCDPDGLAMALGNLVENAVKFTRPGDLVRISAEENEAGYVEIAVSDTGPGIEEAHLARIFERFYRVDKGRSREEGGFGLGLSIAKNAVEAMGGSITATSMVGRGTTFRITLPGGKFRCCQ